MKRLSILVLGAAVFGVNFDASGCEIDTNCTATHSMNTGVVEPAECEYGHMLNLMAEELYNAGNMDFDIDNEASIAAAYNRMLRGRAQLMGSHTAQPEQRRFGSDLRTYTINVNGRVFNAADVSGRGIDACSFTALDQDENRIRFIRQTLSQNEVSRRVMQPRQELLNGVIRELRGNNELQVNRILGYLNFEARLGLDNYLDIDRHLVRNAPQNMRDAAIGQAIGYLQNIANSSNYESPHYDSSINNANRITGLIDALGVIQGANVVVVNNAGVVVSRSPNIHG